VVVFLVLAITWVVVAGVVASYRRARQQERRAEISPEEHRKMVNEKWANTDKTEEDDD
jgi:heme/copper-type cytochrome/quinol oxidase subunit 2